MLCQPLPGSHMAAMSTHGITKRQHLSRRSCRLPSCMTVPRFVKVFLVPFDLRFCFCVREGNVYIRCMKLFAMSSTTSVYDIADNAQYHIVFIQSLYKCLQKTCLYRYEKYHYSHLSLLGLLCLCPGDDNYTVMFRTAWQFH